MILPFRFPISGANEKVNSGSRGTLVSFAWLSVQR